ncbi:MAG: zinc-dependent alcohol dehydrogenase [Promethearchaeota archaeon]
MKGAVYLDKEKVIIKDDLEKPTPAADDVLIKVKYCGICGSGVESYKTGGMYLPNIILGHEFSGEIVEVGENVRKLKVGQRVVVDPNVPCGECYWCTRYKENMCKLSNNALGTTQNGGMAEFINVRADHVHLIPDSMTFQEGACVEPLANCVYAVQESGIKIGENAAVFGAGTIGLMTIQALKAAGVSRIFAIEPVEFKQKKALELGATGVFHPKQYNKVARMTDKIGPDHIFDCVGIPETLMASINLIKKGGHITVIGIHIEPFEMRGLMQVPLKNITLRGVFSFTPDVFQASLDLIAGKQVNGQALITSIIKLDDVPDMFKKLANPPHEEIKVLVEI